MNNATLEMHDALIQTTDWLSDESIPVALVLIETLEPASGADAEIFPPTFAKDKNISDIHPYNIDEWRKDISPSAANENEEVNICLIDSVGSQGNRMEGCFTKPNLSKLVPQIIVTVQNQSANLLDIGHRIADAAIRFSELETEAHNAIVDLEKKGDALKMAKIAPTSLIFGFWDSRGDTKFKFGRILSSTIRATNVCYLTRTSQFENALKMDYVMTKEDFDKYSKKAGSSPSPLAREGLQSQPVERSHGGVRVFGKIIRRTQINLVGLRALAVTNENSEINEIETMKLRRYLLGLALIAARSQEKDNSYALREGCLLTRISEKAEKVFSNGERIDFNWKRATAFAYAQLATKEFEINEKTRKIQFDVSKAKMHLDKKSSE